MRHRDVIVASMLAACGGGTTPQPDALPDDGRTTIVELPATLNRNLDLLFVVDDSAGLIDKQQKLANAMPALIDQMINVPGGLPDLHLGVVTTDMGTSSSLDATPGPPIGQVGQGGCANRGKSGDLTTNGAPVTGAFISDIKLPDGTRQRNYTGDLATTISQMVRLGATGCGFEQPLAAMKAALDNNPANAGFLRPDALLALVFLVDEDDCSAKHATLFGPDGGPLGPLQSFRCTRFGVTCSEGGNDPDEMNQVGAKSGCTATATSEHIDGIQEYRDFLTTLKSDPRGVAVGMIVGTPEPFAVETRTISGQQLTALAHSCSVNTNQGVDVSDPGVRLTAFANLFPERSSTATICQADLLGPLDAIGQLVAQTIGSPCLRQAPRDIDPAVVGEQFDCVVEDLVSGNATVIAECAATPVPTCWRIVADPVNCPRAPQLSIVVERAGAPPPSTVTRMRCKL